MQQHNIKALVGTADVDFASVANFLTDDRAARAAAAEAVLIKVLSLAPNQARADWRGPRWWWQGEHPPPEFLPEPVLGQDAQLLRGLADLKNQVPVLARRSIGRC